MKYLLIAEDEKKHILPFVVDTYEEMQVYLFNAYHPLERVILTAGFDNQGNHIWKLSNNEVLDVKTL